MEYDPEPLFNSGSPKTATSGIVQQALSTMATYMEKLREQSKREVASGVSS